MEMNDDKIRTESLQPGLELDRMVAERIFGWTDFRINEQPHTTIKQLFGVRPGAPVSAVTGKGMPQPVPAFSTDIKAAWEVRAAIAGMLFSKRRAFTDELQLLLSDGLDLGTLIHHSEVIIRVQPHHICLAALQAISR